MKCLKISFVMILAFAGTLLAKDFWAERDYTKWDKREVFKMLSESPWAQTQSFVESMIYSASTAQIMGTTGSTAQPSAAPPVNPPPGAGQGPVPLSGDHQASLLYYIRFYSALPVRQALVRLNMLNGKEPSAAAVDRFLNQPPFPDDMIVAVAAAPGQDRQEFEALTGDLIKNETWLIKKNKERIQLRDYLSPSQAGRTEAYYLFPRAVNGKPTVELKDIEIRFITKLGKRELNRSFKLEKMVLSGKLIL